MNPMTLSLLDVLTDFEGFIWLWDIPRIRSRCLGFVFIKRKSFLRKKTRNEYIWNRDISGKLSHKSSKQLEICDISKAALNLNLHNSTQGPPKRWNDRTPRRRRQVTYFHRGIPAAGEQFSDGVVWFVIYQSRNLVRTLPIFMKFSWLFRSKAFNPPKNKAILFKDNNLILKIDTSSPKHPWAFEKTTQYFPGSK